MELPIVPSAFNGHVVQVAKSWPNRAWVGALLVIDEGHTWGVIGLAPTVTSKYERGVIPLRIEWEHLHYVGPAEPGLITGGTT